nr:immunoglobulin heavy chain junction region [Mus musculus]
CARRGNHGAMDYW